MNKTVEITVKNLCEFDRDSLISQLVDFERAHFKWPWSQGSWESFLASDYHYRLFANMTGHKIHWLVLFNVDVESAQAELLKICLEAPLRGKSLAGAIYDDCLLKLNSLSLNKIILDVETGNHAAIQLYKSRGFKIIHEKKKFYQDGSSAYMMQCALI